MHKIKPILLLILQMLSSIKESDSISDSKRVVCFYHGHESQEVKQLAPENIDASLCTHIMYMFAVIDLDDEKLYVRTIFQINETEVSKHIEGLAKLKEANPKLKFLLLTLPDMKWVLEAPDRSTKIIQSAVPLLNTTGFDGLEFPIPHSGDYGGYFSFLCEMKTEFDNYGYSLSILAPAHILSRSASTTIEKISRCSTFIELITIEPQRILANGTKSLTTINETMIKILNDTTAGWTFTRDTETNVPYAYTNTGKWASYEDEVSLAAKARSILEKDLGGVFIVALDFDDFEGISGKTFPLIRPFYDTFKHDVRARNVTVQ